MTMTKENTYKLIIYQEAYDYIYHIESDTTNKIEALRTFRAKILDILRDME